MEGPSPVNPRKHKNFHLDLECMRLNAEKERISHYKELAISGAIQYYKVLRRILEEGLEQKNGIHYVADYMKAVIENGSYFTTENLFFALDNLNSTEMNEDFIMMIKIIFEELEFDQNDMRLYIQELTERMEFAKRDLLLI